MADDAATAPEPVTLANAVRPAPNRPDEPVAREFSLAAATRFLDSASLDWQKTRKCMTCHTNYAFLMARPAISADSPAHQSVREFAEKLVSERWPTDGPRWDTEIVATATVLAFNDAATTGKLHPLTRQALDKMWTVQRADGGWDWLKCDWPPMESDDHFGATFAAVGIGVAPENYKDTPAAKAGLKKLQAYLQNNPPPTLHHRAMLMWATSYLPELMSEDQRKGVIFDLMALQRPDGGWAVASLGDWKRGDDKPQDTETSDGYGTAFVVYSLRRAGVPANHAQIKQAIAWLKSHQRESGRWYTRSLYKDGNHFLSHAGTAFAVLALSECGEIAGEKK